jgi:hypothetical protein
MHDLRTVITTLSMRNGEGKPDESPSALKESKASNLDKKSGKSSAH